ncbi:hypothetical protein ACQCPQ_31440 (plasmid) [Priestia megaterium]|uniref:hypothetical protein n=1 Tax=Priestia megaterium TaxID=1404 RepID=UPI003D085C88
MKNEVLANLEGFKKLIDQYTKNFGEFYNGIKPIPVSSEISPYELAHNELGDTISELQIAFCELPDQLQRRLLDLGFNTIISYDNNADLYEYRKFVHENDLFSKTLTFTVRIYAEVELAEKFIKLEKWDKYDNLPQKDFNSHEKLLSM